MQLYDTVPAAAQAQAQGRPGPAVFEKRKALCPRSLADAAVVLRAVIDQGLDWGAAGKPFTIGVKSWSGPVGIKLIADAVQSGGTFARNIRCLVPKSTVPG